MSHNPNASILEIHPDIIRTHVLTRLDGPTLVSAGSASSELNNFCKEEELWRKICNSTWPSTIIDRRLANIIATFPAGYKSFFSDSFSTVDCSSNHEAHLVKQETNHHPSLLPCEMISAVDIHYDNNLVYSKVETTETCSDWFLSSPFWVDLFDPKEPIPTSIELFECNNESFRSQINQNLTLSWILVDPVSRRAANLSSLTPISVEHNWLNDGILAHYVTFLRYKSTSELAQCSMVVVCSKEGGYLQLKQVTLLVNDMDGKSLSGKDSLVILQEVMKGGRMPKETREKEKKRYEEFMKEMRERSMRKYKRERRRDTVCIFTGVAIFSLLWMFLSFFIFH